MIAPMLFAYGLMLYSTSLSTAYQPFTFRNVKSLSKTHKPNIVVRTDPRLTRLKLSAPSVPVSTKALNDFTSFGRLAYRFTVFSWWVQIILTVISSVILTFANTVRQSSNSQSLWTSGFAFSSIGVIISFVSSFLTWNNTRICRRLSNEVDADYARQKLKESFKISIVTALSGMFITLLAAEQIVGTLASKVLSLQGIQPIIGTLGQQSTLQALDIFLVQANTNTLVALFSPIICYLSLLQAAFPSIRLKAQ